MWKQNSEETNSTSVARFAKNLRTRNETTAHVECCSHVGRRVRCARVKCVIHLFSKATPPLLCRWFSSAGTRGKRRAFRNQVKRIARFLRRHSNKSEINPVKFLFSVHFLGAAFSLVGDALARVSLTWPSKICIALWLFGAGSAFATRVSRAISRTSTLAPQRGRLRASSRGVSAVVGHKARASLERRHCDGAIGAAPA